MLQSNPRFALSLILGAIFIAGLLLYVLGGMLQRRSDVVLTWAQRIDESASGLDVTQKIELIERLGLIATPWSEQILLQARIEERAPELRRAIDAALEDVRSAFPR